MYYWILLLSFSQCILWKHWTSQSFLSWNLWVWGEVWINQSLNCVSGSILISWLAFNISYSSKHISGMLKRADTWRLYVATFCFYHSTILLLWMIRKYSKYSWIVWSIFFLLIILRISQERNSYSIILPGCTSHEIVNFLLFQLVIQISYSATAINSMSLIPWNHF